MVYIPWAKYGLCRYAMLRRCYSGKDCKWEHPDPGDIKRLWDEHTEQQKMDAEQGISPPRPPPAKTGEDDVYIPNESGSPEPSLRYGTYSRDEFRDRPHEPPPSGYRIDTETLYDRSGRQQEPHEAHLMQTYPGGNANPHGQYREAYGPERGPPPRDFYRDYEGQYDRYEEPYGPDRGSYPRAPRQGYSQDYESSYGRHGGPHNYHPDYERPHDHYSESYGPRPTPTPLRNRPGTESPNNRYEGQHDSNREPDQETYRESSNDRYRRGGGAYEWEWTRPPAYRQRDYESLYDRCGEWYGAEQASLPQSNPWSNDEAEEYRRFWGRPPPPPGHPVLRPDSPSPPRSSDPSNIRSRWDPNTPLYRGREIDQRGSSPSRLYSDETPQGSREEEIEPKVEAEQDPLPEISMLDAPSSPNAVGEKESSPAPDISSEPLSNRHATVDEKGTKTWTGDEQAQFVKKDNVGSTLLAADLPSRNAITLWKRSPLADDSHVTDNEELPRRGGYWDRLRAWQQARKEKEANGSGEDEVIDSFHAEPTKSRDTPAMSNGPHQQTSSNAVSSVPPITSLPMSSMGATKRLSNGEPKHVGPHPSIIRVSKPYISQAEISKKLQQNTSQAQLDIQERSIAEAREDSIRLQGVTWIDTVRRALQLPIKTYTTACVYYHKFRLAHAGSLSGMEYGNAWADACAASLLTSCKVEDTLKKSRDILAAAYNLKASTHDQLGADDPVFEQPSKQVIGLERLVLEAGGFDFRSKYPHQLLVKICKTMPEGVDGERATVAQVSWTILTDLYRTFAPLKQTPSTMALACLELAAHLYAATSANNVSAIRDALQQYDIQKISTDRNMIMETLLDSLDLYTQHTAHTILGTKYSLDDFLRIRLALNKECSESNIPRYTVARSPSRQTDGSTLTVANGHPTPVSPAEAQGQPQQQTTNGMPAVPEGGGTQRFMLNPQLAADEKAVVQKYFVEEWEEYEEEIEVPIARAPSREGEHEAERERPPSERPRETGGVSDKESSRAKDDRDKDGARGKEDREKESVRRKDERDREREKLREKEREVERERARLRERERERDREKDRDGDRRYDDRRYEERERRYDDRRDRRYDERRYEEDRRRSREDRR